MELLQKRSLLYIDWLSLLIMLVLASIGLLFVFSATYSTGLPYSMFFKKQLFGVATGLLIYFFFCAVDYRVLAEQGYFAYIAVMFLLVITAIKGHVGMGAKRWIDVMFFRFQPSELVKLLFPAFVTHYVEVAAPAAAKNNKHFFTYLIGALLFSALLVYKQPDLGTAIIIVASSLVMLWLLGINKKFFIGGTLIFCMSIPIAWKLLKPYQRKRIEVFLGQGEVTRERYQIEQSAIAVGSGGIAGKGLHQGTQNVFHFLPESRTDFIFSVVCEEWGFLGALLVLALYAALFTRLIWMISLIPSFFAKLLATGLFIHMMFSTIVNIGMVIGLLPVVGIPLPLMSYGITNLWITFASLGWINGIVMRRGT